MLRLSVIIVNYNVRFFLEQALLSVRKAIQNINAEVIVVDNNSVDGSIEMLQEKFPEIKLILNKKNTGFATANNQAIRVATGEFILLLNPDTLVEEDTFEKCLGFMQSHPDCGGLGIKMIDGKGKFLPESKRGFPTPFVAFCKAFGLSKIFPRSKSFNRYHLGYLSENETHAVDVLSGAFIFIRKEALDVAGLLDEQFFMYGEDIDLSYRLIKAGYKNYYFPETRVIHYKGESTKKGSMNYVRMFYQAMIIFAQKHFSAGSRSFYVFMLKLAIYLRAFISISARLVKQSSLVVLDVAALYAGLVFIKDYWEHHIKADEGLRYPTAYIMIVIPSYIFIWLVSLFLSGGYEKNAKPSQIVRGLLVGTIIIAAIYAFLPETLRFSRAMILLGAVWAIFIILLIRLLLSFILNKHFRIGESPDKKMVIVGSQSETLRVAAILNQAKVKNDIIGFVSSNGGFNRDSHYLGELQQLKEIAIIYKIDEIIFCGKDVSSQKIIEWMTAIGPDMEYKIVPEDSLSIIGSSSKDAQGELYTIDIKLAIATPFQRRNKRLFDLMASLFLIGTIPVNLLVIPNAGQLINNIFVVLVGKKTWVGYADHQILLPQLPVIKKGILTPLDEFKNTFLDEAAIRRINLLYGKNYSISKDLELMVRCYRKLGKK